MVLKFVCISFYSFLMGILSLNVNAQGDSTWYLSFNVRYSLFNSFKTQDFSAGWENGSMKTPIKSIGLGLSTRSGSTAKDWRGVTCQIKSTSSEALSRSRIVSIGAPFTTERRNVKFSEVLSLTMINAGLLYYRSFQVNSRSGFFINPSISVGIMHEKITEEYEIESNRKGLGIDLSSGIVWHLSKNFGLSAILNYRSLKLKMDYMENYELINWSGLCLEAGICISIP